MSTAVPTRLRGGVSIVIAARATEAELHDRLARLGVARRGLCETTFITGSASGQTAASIQWTYRTLPGETPEDVVADVDARIAFALRGLKGVSVLTVAYTNDAPDEPPEVEHTH